MVSFLQRFQREQALDGLKRVLDDPAFDIDDIMSLTSLVDELREKRKRSKSLPQDSQKATLKISR